MDKRVVSPVFAPASLQVYSTAFESSPSTSPTFQPIQAVSEALTSSRSAWQGGFWSITWLLVNLTLASLNKSVFQFGNFNFPLTLSICHLATSSALAWLSILAGAVQFKGVERGQLAGVVLLSVLFWTNIVFGNWSVQVVSLAFSSTMRSVIPAVTMLLSRLILGSKYTSKQVAAVFVIVIGVAWTTYTEVNVQLSQLFVLIVGILLCATKVVFTGRMLVGAKKLHPIVLLAILAPLSVIQMLVWGLVIGELAEVRRSFSTFSRGTIAMVGVTSILSFVLNYTNFMTNRATSPLTLTILGNLKAVTTIAISFAFFDSHVRLLNVLGIGVPAKGPALPFPSAAVTIAGAAYYSWLQYLEKEKKSGGDKA